MREHKAEHDENEWRQSGMEEMNGEKRTILKGNEKLKIFF